MEPCFPKVCQQGLERPVFGRSQSAVGFDLVDDQHSIPSEKEYPPASAPSLETQVGKHPLDISEPFETGDSSKSTTRQSPLESRLSPTTGQDAAIDAARHQRNIEPSHKSPPRCAFPNPITSAELPATSKYDDGNVTSRLTEDGDVSGFCGPVPSPSTQGNGDNRTPRNCSTPLPLPAKAPDPRSQGLVIPGLRALSPGTSQHISTTHQPGPPGPLPDSEPRDRIAIPKTEKTMWQKFRRLLNVLKRDRKNNGTRGTRLANPALDGGSAGLATSKPSTAPVSIHRGSSRRKRMKRKAEDTYEGAEHAENTRSNEPKRSKHDGDTKRQMACHFFLHDPIRYWTCSTSVLVGWSDVKHHLKTSHYRSNTCPNCGQRFTSHAACDEHIVACEVVSLHVVVNTGDEIDEDAQREIDALTTRRRCKSNFELWYTAWRIIFPTIAQPLYPFARDPRIELREAFLAPAATSHHALAARLVCDGLIKSEDNLSPIVDHILGLVRAVEIREEQPGATAAAASLKAQGVPRSCGTGVKRGQPNQLHVLQQGRLDMAAGTGHNPMYFEC